MEEREKTEKEKIEIKRLIQEQKVKEAKLKSMQHQFEKIRAQTPQHKAPRLEGGEINDYGEKRKTRRVTSLRRYKLNPDGTKRFMSKERVKRSITSLELNNIVHSKFVHD